MNVDGIKTYYFKNVSMTLAANNIPFSYDMPSIIKNEIKKFDIIHIHEYRTIIGTIVWHYAKKSNMPIIFQARGSLVDSDGKNCLKKTYDVFCGFKFLKYAKKCIALNEREQKQYIDMGVSDRNIKIIPNGIDLSIHNKLPEEGNFRKRYNINSDEKIILSLSRIHKIKGIDLLVDSFADLTGKISKVKLVIVGPDDGYLSQLKEKVRLLELEKDVVFTGPLYDANKFEAYVDSDLYVLPSRYETFPNTVIEAWVCRKPVIVTDRCGISNLVRRAGSVVSFNKKELVEIISKYLNDEDLRKRDGNLGQKIVREHFNWNKIVLDLEDIYNN